MITLGVRKYAQPFMSHPRFNPEFPTVNRERIPLYYRDSNTDTGAQNTDTDNTVHKLYIRKLHILELQHLLQPSSRIRGSGERSGSSYERSGSSWERSGSSYERPGSSGERSGSSGQRSGSSYHRSGSSCERPGSSWEQQSVGRTTSRGGHKDHHHSQAATHSPLPDANELGRVFIMMRN